MILNEEIINWVEYTICEKSTDIFYKCNPSYSRSYYEFCKRLRESIIDGDLSARESNILNSIMLNTNRQYNLSDIEISKICSNFFIDEKWYKYTRAIKLMSKINWELPSGSLNYIIGKSL